MSTKYTNLCKLIFYDIIHVCSYIYTSYTYTHIRMVQLKDNLMPTCGWQVGQPQADQQDPSKRVQVPTKIPNCDRQHPSGTHHQEPVALI